ncbi:oxygen-dependent protoporphyrinogen oxidase [Sporothrix eucalyptigena]|uniref:Oxygen-dependent protoporphyrinogen oxidase n=1 Tax=Sporothrix eucalyptigena TaxID=1812306 RepID=A0ABP0BDV8_9PEZI
MGPHRGACAAVAARTALARRQLWSATERRTAYLRTQCCAVACRGFASSAAVSSPSQKKQPPPKRVAVVGGGLTGLATAHYLSYLLPATSQIVLYEGSGRTGGWIDSGKAEGTEELPLEEATFEGGARMVAPQRSAVRFDDLLLLELIDQLKLVDELRVSNARPNQYIYYPDHLVNIGILSNRPMTGLFSFSMLSWAVQCLLHMSREPLFKGFFGAGLGMILPSTAKAEKIHERMNLTSRAPGRVPPPSADESVGDYVLRASDGRGHAVVDNMLSAVMHGIYGGDVWKLSVASSIMRSAWIDYSVRPVFQLYVRQARIAEMRRRRAEATGGQPEEHPDFPGQNDGEGGGVAGYPPLTKETLSLAYAYDSGRGIKMAMVSDVELLNDLTERMRERHDRWEAEQEKAPTPGETNPADGLGMLGVASTQWTQFGFEKGFGTLTEALARSLRSKPNVQIRTGKPVTALTYKDGKVLVTTEQSSEGYDRVASTVASPTLYRLAGGSDSNQGLLPALRHEHAVTIMVVNLYYAEPALHAPYKGFGYLIPQTVPLDQNPEGALGVIFDSDREADARPLFDEERYASPIEQLGEKLQSLDDKVHESIRACHEDTARYARGSKYTVMMGGHYWDGYSEGDYPSPEEAVEMAEAVLQRHLRDTPGFGNSEKPPRPVATQTKLCRECIPQHYVGHAERMAKADLDLRRSYGGQLTVAGGSFTAVGPGVLPSVRSAYDVALRVAGRGYRMARIVDGRNETTMDHVGDTGLARFADPATDGIVPAGKDLLPLRFMNQTVYTKGQWGRLEKVRS